MIVNIFSGLALILFSIILIRQRRILYKNHKKIHFLMFGIKPLRTRIMEGLVLVTNYPMIFMWALFSVGLLKNEYLGIFNRYTSILGLLYLYVGLVIYALALKELGVSWQLGVEYNGGENFVRSKIYTISRHPAYVGFYLMFIGIIFIYPMTIFAGIPSMIALFLLAKEEERYLLYRYGDEYRDYKSQVRMLFGRKKNKKAKKEMQKEV